MFNYCSGSMADCFSSGIAVTHSWHEPNPEHGKARWRCAKYTTTNTFPLIHSASHWEWRDLSALVWNVTDPSEGQKYDTDEHM